MKHSIDKALLFAYLSGEATAEQKRHVELWLSTDPIHWDYFYVCLEEWEKNHQQVEFDEEADFGKLTRRIYNSELPAHEPEKARANKLNIAFTYNTGDNPGQQNRHKLTFWVRKYANHWQSVAAFILVLFTFIALFFIIPGYKEMNTYTTFDRKTRKVILPDRSVVVLNTNSTIKFYPGWDHEKPREIWLEGEAFFSVIHTKSHQKFIVHTSDQFNVEVLGTQFNVSKRLSRTRVVLNSGKIRLHIRNTGDKATSGLTMKPGELIEFKQSPGQLIRKTVNPEIYSCWKDNRLIFKNTPLYELSMLLEERYGLKVILKDTSLHRIRFNGDFPSGNLNMLLKALETTYDLIITVKPNEIHFQSRINKN